MRQSSLSLYGAGGIIGAGIGPEDWSPEFPDKQAQLKDALREVKNKKRFSDVQRELGYLFGEFMAVYQRITEFEEKWLTPDELLEPND